MSLSQQYAVHPGNHVLPGVTKHAVSSLAVATPSPAPGPVAVKTMPAALTLAPMSVQVVAPIVWIVYAAPVTKFPPVIATAAPVSVRQELERVAVATPSPSPGPAAVKTTPTALALAPMSVQIVVPTVWIVYDVGVKTYVAVLLNVPGVVTAPSHSVFVVGVKTYVTVLVNVPGLVTAASHNALVVAPGTSGSAPAQVPTLSSQAALVPAHAAPSHVPSGISGSAPAQVPALSSQAA
jgi:hypothetical protein